MGVADQGNRKGCLCSGHTSLWSAHGHSLGPKKGVELAKARKESRCARPQERLLENDSCSCSYCVSARKSKTWSKSSSKNIESRNVNESGISFVSDWIIQNEDDLVLHLPYPPCS